MMDPLLFVLLCLATFRLTRLFTDDAITLPLRSRLEARRFVGYLVTCRWCLSIWLGIPLAVVATLWGDHSVIVAVLAGLSASAVTGLLSRWD